MKPVRTAPRYATMWHPIWVAVGQPIRREAAASRLPTEGCDAPR
jgi:hypothetical protein